MPKTLHTNRRLRLCLVLSGGLDRSVQPAPVLMTRKVLGCPARTTPVPVTDPGYLGQPKSAFMSDSDYSPLPAVAYHAEVKAKLNAMTGGETLTASSLRGHWQPNQGQPSQGQLGQSTLRQGCSGQIRQA